MSLALLVAQNSARELAEGKTVDKWQVYRWLCEGKSLIGVTDRALAILAALLSFHPDNELNEEGGLIVFPSNKQLSLRAHGMPDTTLRRHLGNLVDCGIIIRRDSPNGKRYARKGRGGELEEAFGFSLAPLLARAEEFQDAAERIQAENRALKLMRERITLYRRDIGKLIEAAVEEGVPGNWTGILERFRAIVDRLPRRATATDLEPFVARLANLREEVDNILNSHMNAKNPDGNESHNGRQHSNSNTDPFIEFEPALEKSGDEAAAAKETPEPLKGYPLGLVLRACPDIADYSTSGIASWRDLMATAAQVRGYLGVSPSAYADALDVMGQETTAIVIACMLQRANHINSAGGYLRTLTEKARAGQFSVGPMLMACLKANAGSERKAG